MSVKRILFVCTGDSCRSVMAQGLLQQIGVDCSSHRARRLTSEIIHAADLMFAMEQFQVDENVRQWPEVKGKTHLLKPYGLQPHQVPGNPNIPDPIGKPLEVYEVCFTEIRDAIERVAKSFGVPK